MIAHRAATSADHAFICDNWIRSYRNSDTAGVIPMARWREIMWPIVEAVMLRPGAVTLVACDPQHQDDLYGFICADPNASPPVVFYTYTKQAYRNGKTIGLPLGIARGLFRAVGVDPEARFVYAFKTSIVAELARKLPLAKWDAMVARFPKETR